MNDLTPVAPHQPEPKPPAPGYSERELRRQVFAEVSARITQNEYQLPSFLFRADLVPPNLLQEPPVEQDVVLEAATIPISYREGYPTFMNGSAFWRQMEHEPDDAYDLFKAYVKLIDYTGVRQVETLHEEDPTELATYGIEIPLHLQDNGFSLDDLVDYYVYYFWDARARAHDMFVTVSAHRLRERRIQSTTNSHYLKAEQVFAKVMRYFDMTDEETGELLFLEEMTPKVAVEILERLVKVQRVSLSLPAHGFDRALLEQALPENADASSLMQLLAQKSAVTEDGNTSRGNEVAELLQNSPDAVKMVQELTLLMDPRRQADAEAAQARQLPMGDIKDGGI